MIELRFDELAQMTGGRLVNDSHAALRFRGASIDSRTVRDGELFVAIEGERCDGHDYVKEAIRRGAGGVLASHRLAGKSSTAVEYPVVTVDNSHEAMIELASIYLGTLTCRRIGITGTNGKTTTKELAFLLAREAVPTAWRTPGNYNNLFGIPLSILSIPSDCTTAFFEMGISKPGEMGRLASIVRPEIALITNVGPSHLEFLDSVEKVIEEKLQILKRAVPESIVIYNGDDDLLARELLKMRQDAVSFGMTNESNIFPEAVETLKDGSHSVTIDGCTFVLPLFGGHQVYNLLAAYAIFVSLGYDKSSLRSGTLRLTSGAMRGQILQHDDVTIVLDCYNANPDSVTAGLESFDALETSKRKVVILGDMLELGQNERRYHEEIGRLLYDLSFDLHILVGPCCGFTAEAAISAGVDASTVIYFADADSAESCVGDLIRKSDIIYVKGSRGIGLERTVSRFTKSGESV